ncbi:hypothetical protein GQ600_15438 [Phytophthora cactorum]|nr:hypothetical protein GQ600_15438 [Phytophthora cactorum]
MAKGSTTVPATPSKSGGARNESSSPDVTAARLAAVSELSVSFEDEEEHGRTPKMITMIMKTRRRLQTRRCDSGDGHAIVGAERGDEVTFEEPRRRARRRCGPDPDYDDFNDGTEAFSVLNAPRPPINGDTPAAKRVFDRKGRLAALANELQYPVNSVSTSQVAEDSVSLLLALGYEKRHWSPHEAGAALQKWKKKLRKAFATSKSLATLEEDPSKVPLPRHPRGSSVLLRLSVEPTAMLLALPTLRPTPRLAHGDATFNKSYATYGRRGRGDDDDLLPPTYEDEDPQAELTRQMREIAALNDSDPTPRIEMASHRPLDRIKPFSGSRNKSENSMQWLRTFVYEMTGTHTEADKWCIPFEAEPSGRSHPLVPSTSEEDETHVEAVENAFIRYYCSHLPRLLCPLLLGNSRRVDGAKEHVQQFLVTCGDDNMAESLYHTRVNDIHELEEIIEDVLKGKAMASVTVRSRRDDYRNTPRVTLADASLDDLLAELEGREATRSAHEDDQDEYDHYQSDDASSDGSLVDNDRHLAAANEGERRAAAEGTYARSDNRPPRGNTQIASEASIKTVAVASEPSIRTVEAHDAGQCELFRNFQDLAKFVRIKGTKEELPPELNRTFHGRECIFAFMGNGKWPDDYITSVKATENEKERSQVLGGGVEDVMECADVDGSISEDSFGRVSSATSHAPKGHSKMMRLNPGEKQGWWSAKKFDRRSE